MKNLQFTKKQINIIVLIASAAVITVVSIALALLGTRVYTGAAADKSQKEVYDTTMYFTEQLRKCESFSGVRVAALGGKIPALVISRENSNGEKTGETWYFAYEGFLRKADVTAGKAVTAESGKAAVALTSAEFRIVQPGLLEIAIITESGENTTLNIHFANSGGDVNE